jgi:hypothetical protein
MIDVPQKQCANLVSNLYKSHFIRIGGNFIHLVIHVKDDSHSLHFKEQSKMYFFLSEMKLIFKQNISSFLPYKMVTA